MRCRGSYSMEHEVMCLHHITKHWTQKWPLYKEWEIQCNKDHFIQAEGDLDNSLTTIWIQCPLSQCRIMYMYICILLYVYMLQNYINNCSLNSHKNRTTTDLIPFTSLSSQNKKKPFYNTLEQFTVKQNAQIIFNCQRNRKLFFH